MDIFLGIGGLGSNIISYVLPFLFVLTVVVFFHELGHFWVGRKCGVDVETFSVGFGREIWGWTDKLGTRWKLGWVPLGGYVKFAGDSGNSSTPDDENLAGMSTEQRARTLHGRPLAQRMAVVAAGPVANFILAIVLFSAIFMLAGKYVTLARVDALAPGAAAELAGFEVGDVIVSIDGDSIESFDDVQRVVSISAGRELLFTVERAGERVNLPVTPRMQEIEDPFGAMRKVGYLGVQRNNEEGGRRLIQYGPLAAMRAGVQETWFIATRTLEYLFDIITGHQDTSQLGGPLGIANISGKVASVSFVALVNLTAILSVSIGLINLFPIPLLDGGHLLYYSIEGVLGRPMGKQLQEIGFRIGLAFIIMIMLFATWNDLVNLRVVDYLTNLLT